MTDAVSSEAADGAAIDLGRTPLKLGPFDGAGGAIPLAPDPNDPGLGAGQILFHLAVGASPQDFHPAVQPMAQTYGLLLRPGPSSGPGLLGSADDIRRAANAPLQAEAVVDASPPSAVADWNDALPDLHIPEDGSHQAPLGLQVVDGLPISGGSNAISRFDGLIADKVSSFFKAMQDQNMPVELAGGFRPAGAQARYTGNKYGGAKPGNGLHEAGLAFDVNWAGVDGPQQARAVQIAKGLGLKWGGDFRKPDSIHFYVDPFATLADRQAYIRALQQGQ